MMAGLSEYFLHMRSISANTGSSYIVFSYSPTCPKINSIGLTHTPPLYSVLPRNDLPDLPAIGRPGRHERLVKTLLTLLVLPKGEAYILHWLFGMAKYKLSSHLAIAEAEPLESLSGWYHRSLDGSPYQTSACHLWWSYPFAQSRQPRHPHLMSQPVQ